MFPTSSFDPETLGVLTGVFEDAWIDIQGMLGPTPIDPEGLRSALARRIMAADERGERDPRRLRQLAMGAIDA